MTAPLPDNEPERLDWLRQSGVLDTPAEDAFDDLVCLAAQVCGVPIAAVSLIDSERQWFKSIVGLTISETPREQAFCAHTILQPEVMIVADAQVDPRFQDNPLVTGDPNIRFYAGAPLVTSNGYALGSLCVIDRVPRQLTEQQRAVLEVLARQVAGRIEMQHHLAAQEQMIAEQARLMVERERTLDALRDSEDGRRAAEEEYRGLFERAAEGIFQTSPDGAYLRANPTLARIYGYDGPAQMIATLADVGSQIYVESGQRAEFERLLRERGTVTGFESQVRRRDGAVIWISESARAVHDASGRLVRYEGFVKEITERKTLEAERERATAALRESHAHLAEGELHMRLALESGGLGAFLLDVTTRQFLVVSDACRSHFVLAKEGSSTLADLLARLHPDDRDGARAALMRSVNGGGDYQDEYRTVWPDGGVHWISARGRLVADGSGAATRMVGVTQDITERKVLEGERERELCEAQERADRDPLTGLWNHRAFHARFEAEAARAQREGTGLAVAMLDLDNFKFFNDAHGHVVGDEVLRTVAGQLLSVCRPYDTVARFGGDEFALLLTGVSGVAAGAVEARLRADLAGLTHLLAGQEAAIPITVSVGAALLSPLGHDRQEALRQADERLLRSKTGGAIETEADEVRARAAGEVAGFSMLDALVTAVDNKDRYTRRHSEDVMAYSLMIAHALGLDEQTQQAVAVAALLHDVGKIGVPDAILRKPGTLTEAEVEAVRQHPQMGAALVSTVAGLEATLDAVRHHHERWDGGGYPSGLNGEETPLMARLMAVADAFSAMTTDRPYRKGMDKQRALAILENGAGTQWDPDCVGAFLKALERLQAAWTA